MRLYQFFDAEVHRGEKLLLVRFLVPFRVISTCPVNGGIREDVQVVFNHQACEPKGHNAPLLQVASQNAAAYHQVICARCGLDPASAASLATAANMNNLGLGEARYRDLHVVALATGGVETNAGRAGDPACFYEVDGRYEPVEEETTGKHGTINTIVLINQELTRGAMVRAVVTITEAKSALLQELGVGSCYSDGLATGTGTDQVAIASRLGGYPLSVAGKHSKLGELIARAVHAAIKEALAMQNQLIPQSQCSVLAHLCRLGTGATDFLRRVERFLPAGQADLLARNFTAVERDPLTVAAVAALVHLRDKVVWGVLPDGCLQEILGSYGAQITAAVSGSYERIPAYREKLGQHVKGCGGDAVVELAAEAIALGFSDKWEHLERSGYEERD